MPNKFLEIKPDGSSYFFEYRDPRCNLELDKFSISEDEIIIEKEFYDIDNFLTYVLIVMPVTDFKFDYPYNLGEDEYIASYQKIAQKPNVCKITIDKNLFGKWQMGNESPTNICEETSSTIEFFANQELEKIKSVLVTSENHEDECAQSFITKKWFNLTSNDGLDQLVTFIQEGEIILFDQVWDYKVNGNELSLIDFNFDKVEIYKKFE